MFKDRPTLKKYICIYSILWVLGAGIIAVPMLRDNLSLIHSGDGHSESFAVFVFIGRYLKNLFTGHFESFSFIIGYGEDIIGTLGIHGFGDPLNLFAIFANDNNADLIYSFLILMRMYLCGVTAYLYLRNKISDGIPAISAALFYAFSSYVIFWGMDFYPFLNSIYVYPLVLLFFEKCLRNNVGIKDKMGFILSIALLALFGYFYLYMISLLLVLYYFFVLCDYRKSCIKPLLSVVLYYILGVFLSFSFLFPTIISFLKSNRSKYGDYGWNIICEAWKQKEWFRGLYAIEYRNSLTIPVISLVAIIICILNCRKDKRLVRETLFGIFLVLASLSPAFCRVISGFGEGYTRWIFAIYLQIGYLCVKACYVKGQRILSLIAIVLSCIVIWKSMTLYLFKNHALELTVCYLVVFGISCLTIFLQRGVYLAIILNVFLNIFVVFGPKEMGCMDWLNDKFLNREDVIQETQIGKRTENLNRYDGSESSYNESLIGDYCSTTEYFSVINAPVTELLRDLCVNSSLIAPHQRVGIDNREALRILVNSKDEKEEAYDTFGLFYSDSMSYEELMKYDYLDRESLLMKYCVLHDTKNIDDNEDIILPECKEIPASVIRTDEAISVSKEADVTEGNSETYLFIKNVSLEKGHSITINVQGKNIVINDNTVNYYTGMGDILVKIDPQKDIEINFTDSIGILYDSIQLLSVDRKEEYKEILSSDKKGLVEYSYGNDKLIGRCEALSDGYLFVPISYSDFWHVYIDGKRQKVWRANIGFMAVELKEGEHSVEFLYRPWPLYVGYAVSILGIIGLLIVFYIDKKKVGFV